MAGLDPVGIVPYAGHDIELVADVYRPDHPGTIPAVLWLHGGALIGGSRRDIRSEQLERYLGAGWAVVAPDYRLAPEHRLPEIGADVRAAHRWLVGPGEKDFGLDPTRFAVVGHSAGGYLALLCGPAFAPSPRAIVSFYGYGDLAGDWSNVPAPSGSHKGVVPDPTYLASHGDRMAFYRQCRAYGTWARQVTGIDPLASRDALLPFCPEGSVSASHPPTMLLHGGLDQDVPVDRSTDMAAALAVAGVPHELLILERYGHDFDNHQDEPEVRHAFDAAIAFLDRWLA